MLTKSKEEIYEAIKMDKKQKVFYGIFYAELTQRRFMCKNKHKLITSIYYLEKWTH